MPATKVNLSQMVDLAVGTPEVGTVNSNVLHTLLHAMLRQLNIVDVQADLNDFDRDLLSASKARELSFLSDVDSGRGDDAGEDAFSERSSSMPTQSTPYHLPEVKIANIQEELKNITSIPSNKHLFKNPRTPYKGKPIAETWLNMTMSRVITNEKKIAKPSRPTSLRSVTCGAELEKLGGSHEVLSRRVEELEAEMWKKLDQGALDGLNVSSELLEQLQELKEQIDAVAAAREQISETLEPLEPLLAPPPTRSVTFNENLLRRHENEMQDLTIIYLQKKVSMLEDQLNLIQGMIKHDSTRWEIKHGTDFEEEIRHIFNQNEPDKPRNLAYVVNDQLHDIRDDIITLEEELKKKDKVVEIPFVQVKSEPVEILLEETKAGFKDTDHDALLKSQNANREEFKKLFAYCDELQMNKADRTDELRVNKADIAEVDVKADKRTLDNKVDHPLLDTKTIDTSKEIKEILNKKAVNEESWNQQCIVFSDDIDRKLDCLELKPLKEWLLRRLKALNDKLKKQNQAHVRRLEALDDKLPTGDTSTYTSSGSRSNVLLDTKTTNISKMIKEILDRMAVNEEAWNQKCKLFSNDIDRKLDRLELKPVKEWLLRRLKALSDKLKKQNQAHVRRLKALNDKLPTGDTSACTVISGSGSNINVDLTVTEKQKAKVLKSYHKVFRFISERMLKPFIKEKSQ